VIDAALCRHADQRPLLFERRAGPSADKVVAYAKCMDERGYDTFWMAEHHFQPEGTELIPNLLMMAMHLCGITKNLNIGCGFNIVPMWHPLRLAEDYAMADILTG
jgi:alkanesulfonate monooxygenase SsuD/methylene tetrahydromethanopterin reductase-like flavin-dependent oxidoreductase (luciferase family)